jgi:hypothetical protein|nr:MAG TPA: hypothetical protein [Caudoviricetes sp.]
MVMYFHPHILQLKVFTSPERDEYNRPIPGTGSESWKTVGRCRCDDNTTREFKSENGKIYRPLYHVVSERNPMIKAGDYIRCLDGDKVRGEGEVYIPKSTNFFSYSEYWI